MRQIQPKYTHHKVEQVVKTEKVVTRLVCPVSGCLSVCETERDWRDHYKLAHLPPVPTAGDFCYFKVEEQIQFYVEDWDSAHSIRWQGPGWYGPRGEEHEYDGNGTYIAWGLASDIEYDCLEQLRDCVRRIREVRALPEMSEAAPESVPEVKEKR